MRSRPPQRVFHGKDTAQRWACRKRRGGQRARRVDSGVWRAPAWSWMSPITYALPCSILTPDGCLSDSHAIRWSNGVHDSTSGTSGGSADSSHYHGWNVLRPRPSPPPSPHSHISPPSAIARPPLGRCRDRRALNGAVHGCGAFDGLASGVPITGTITAACENGGRRLDTPHATPARARRELAPGRRRALTRAARGRRAVRQRAPPGYLCLLRVLLPFFLEFY